MAGNNKKQRTRGPDSSRQRGSTVRTNNRGAKKSPLGYQERILMGKGRLKSLAHVPCSTWIGTNSVTVPWDAVQAKKNEAEGLCG